MMNSDDQISLITSLETLYFSHWNGALCQWIIVTFENHGSNVLTGIVEITIGNHNAETPVELQPGIGEYRCYAPCLFPEPLPKKEAHLALKVGEMTLAATIPAGTYRPWKIYLLSDVCSDITWLYRNWEGMSRDAAMLTRAELNLAKETRNNSIANHNHYNLVQSHEIFFFLEHFPELEQNLVEAIREGEITLNPFHTMVDTADISLEEQIRQFYPARNWAFKHGLEIGYANHQETPTISWSMTMVLAGSGVRHLVKAMLPYECPWVVRLVEPPIFIWQGPDGSQVLMRRRNINYVEGNFVLKGLEETNKVLHETIIPSYQALSERYPFDAIAVLGLYGDLMPENHRRQSGPAEHRGEIVPQCHTLVTEKVNTIIAYNNQGWEYPQLLNAAHKQFWDDIDNQIAKRQISLEVFRGDYGTSWDAWPVCLAYDVAAWRRVQERIGTADKLAAILSHLGILQPGLKESLSEAWLNLIYLSDHAWNGADEENRLLNKTLRRKWQQTSNQLVDKIIADELDCISQDIPHEGGNFVSIFNSLGWERTGLVRLEGLSRDYHISLPDGTPVPTQPVHEDGKDDLYFAAENVPSLGYRVYQIEAGENILPEPVCKADGFRLDGPFYSVEVSPVTGGITRLYDKKRGLELAKTGDPYHINQCVYLSENQEFTPQKTDVISAASGMVFGQIKIQTQFKGISLKTIYQLYANSDQIDITNELEKVSTSEKQELDFVFPFNVRNSQMRFETPAAIIEPGKDHLPGAGLAATAIRHFVDVFNDQHGVTLTQADSFLVEFGHRTTVEDPQILETNNGTVLAVAMCNLLDWDENIHDQGGENHFTFRYSLRAHDGGFNPTEALHFGWQDNNEMMVIPLKNTKNGRLPNDIHSFVSVTPPNVILTSLKPAEEEGLILRLWEISGRDTIAQLNVSGLANVTGAWQTDLLERDLNPLVIKNGMVEVPLKGRGLTTVRLVQ